MIDLRDLYASIARSIDEANRLLDESAQEAEFSYAITELDISVPFREISVEDDKVGIVIANGSEQADATRSLSFKVRYVPRTTVQQPPEPDPTPRPVKVPDLRGSSLEQAQEVLAAAGLKPGKISYSPRQRPAGRVVGQSPDPETLVKPGTSVDLVVAGAAITRGGSRRARKTEDEEPES